MDYLFIALGFLATLVATLGKTKDSSKEGIKALLPLGWLALVISAAMVSLTTYKTYRTNVELTNAATTAANLESVAKRALQSSLRQSLDGANVLYRQCSSGANFPAISSLQEPSFLTCVSDLDARRSANDPNYADIKNPEQSIADVMSRVSVSGREKLWRDIMNYKSAIPGPLWAKLSSYHEHRAFPIFEDIKINKVFPAVPHIVIEKDGPAMVAFMELVQEALAIENELNTENSSNFKKAE